MTARAHMVFSVIMSVVVVAAVAWGIVVVGTPGATRLHRLDQRRLEDLQTIFREVQSLCHDPDIKELPHVPGHELCGIVEAVGPEVRRWRGGERVILPVVSGCGRCSDCLGGQHQVCADQFQPGFTSWAQRSDRLRRSVSICSANSVCSGGRSI